MRSTRIEADIERAAAKGPAENQAFEMTISPDELLHEVKDRKTFIRFVQALADERERAREIERANPDAYIVDGALNWKNGDIANFLHAGLEYFEAHHFHRPEVEPSWRMFAEFLYFGKIYE